jgi:hypothetical protein
MLPFCRLARILKMALLLEFSVLRRKELGTVPTNQVFEPTQSPSGIGFGELEATWSQQALKIAAVGSNTRSISSQGAG